MPAFRRPWLLVLIAGLLAALAAAGYLATRDESGEVEQVAGAVALQGGDPAPPPEVRGSARQVTTTSGLQTAVPEVLGYDQRRAIYTLEDGGFRVRVLERKVSDSRDEGVVVQQVPRGGVTRRVGWHVTIFVGR